MLNFDGTTQVNSADSRDHINCDASTFAETVLAGVYDSNFTGRDQRVALCAAIKALRSASALIKESEDRKSESGMAFKAIILACEGLEELGFSMDGRFAITEAKP